MTMQARLNHPALVVPGTLEPAQRLRASATMAGVPETMVYVQRFGALFGTEG
jgi:hypothetical protein